MSTTASRNHEPYAAWDTRIRRMLAMAEKHHLLATVERLKALLLFGERQARATERLDLTGLDTQMRRMRESREARMRELAFREMHR